MKLRILLLAILFQTIGFSQETQANFQLNSRKVTWQKIFELKTNSSQDIKKIFKKNVAAKIASSDLIELDGTISFKVENELINFRKYGGTLFTIPVFLEYPLNFRVVSEFKNNRYRVTISNITATTNGTSQGFVIFEDLITRKQGTVFNQGKISQRAIQYLNMYFNEQFTLSLDKEDW